MKRQVELEWKSHHEYDASTSQVDGYLEVEGVKFAQLDFITILDEEISKEAAEFGNATWVDQKVAYSKEPVTTLIVPSMHQMIMDEAMSRFLAGKREMIETL